MEIDLGAIGRNLHEIRRILGPQRKIVAALKADAYGHGAVAAAQVLAASGADYLAVGSVEEAAIVRGAGIDAPIVLLGNSLPEAAGEIVRLGVIASLEERALAMALAASARNPIPVFVKVDGGFGRFGVPLSAAAPFIRFVAAEPRLRLEGLYTHLPFSDAAGRSWAERQCHAFEALVAELAQQGLRPPVTQAMASPALLTGLGDDLNASTVGHLLFGLMPVARELHAGPTAFAPALLSVRTRLVHLGTPLPAGQSAGYLKGRSGPLGVVPIGIQHGYRPQLGTAAMLLGGKRVPVLRACLENTIIDLSGVPAPALGAEVIVLGGDEPERISLQELADWHGTSPLALLVTLGKSIPRRYRRPA
ncbi:MAG: alanine racemase [Proteobacteria bacterium]|nr:alanine racemase [Pseudomonadota bacterium]